jgi:hypothetical protein
MVWPVSRFDITKSSEIESEQRRDKKNGWIYGIKRKECGSDRKRERNTRGLKERLHWRKGEAESIKPRQSNPFPYR